MLEVIKQSFFSPFKSSSSCKHVAPSAAVCLDCWGGGGGWSSASSYQQTGGGGRRRGGGSNQWKYNRETYLSDFSCAAVGRGGRCGWEIV